MTGKLNQSIHAGHLTIERFRLPKRRWTKEVETPDGAKRADRAPTIVADWLLLVMIKRDPRFAGVFQAIKALPGLDRFDLWSLVAAHVSATKLTGAGRPRGSGVVRGDDPTIGWKLINRYKVVKGESGELAAQYAFTLDAQSAMNDLRNTRRGGYATRRRRVVASVGKAAKAAGEKPRRLQAMIPNAERDAMAEAGAVERKPRN